MILTEKDLKLLKRQARQNRPGSSLARNLLSLYIPGGKMVRNNETGWITGSQRDMARLLGISRGRLATHLNKPWKQPTVQGLTFTRLTN